MAIYLPIYNSSGWPGEHWLKKAKEIISLSETNNIEADSKSCQPIVEKLSLMNEKNQLQIFQLRHQRKIIKQEIEELMGSRQLDPKDIPDEKCFKIVHAPIAQLLRMSRDEIISLTKCKLGKNEYTSIFLLLILSQRLQAYITELEEPRGLLRAVRWIYAQ